MVHVRDEAMTGSDDRRRNVDPAAVVAVAAADDDGERTFCTDCDTFLASSCCRSDDAEL